jgi:hypothetical protein
MIGGKKMPKKIDWELIFMTVALIISIPVVILLIVNLMRIKNEMGL